MFYSHTASVFHAVCVFSEIINTGHRGPFVKDKTMQRMRGQVPWLAYFSKVLETILLARLQEYRTTTDNHFALEHKHGTDFCNYALKEFVNKVWRIIKPQYLCISLMRSKHSTYSIAFAPIHYKDFFGIQIKPCKLHGLKASLPGDRYI